MGDEEDTLVSTDNPTNDFFDYPVAYAASFASFASPPRAAPHPGLFSRVSYSGPSDRFGSKSSPSIVPLKSYSAPVPKLAPQPAYDDICFVYNNQPTGSLQIDSLLQDLQQRR